MLPKFDLQIMTKFDLQILTKFGYTEMSARACCMRECPRSLHERALARCTREPSLAARESPRSLHERALAAKMTKFWLFPFGTAKSQ